MASLAAVAQPANDNCATATVISSLPYSNSSIPASSCTTSTQDTTCNSGTGGWYDVWWVYTPATNINFAMSETSSIDTFQAIYTGSCGGLTQVICTDPESATFNMTGGTTYYIQLGKWSSTAPAAGVNYSVLYEAIAPPSNDTCATATVISPAALPSLNTVDARLATHDLPPATCDASADPNQRYCVWYTFTSPLTSSYTLSETSTSDTIRAVWSGACGSLTQVRCDDPESATFSLTAGTQYWFSCATWSSTSPPPQPYVLRFAYAASNDECSGAIPIACGGAVTVDNTGASSVPGDPLFSCRTGAPSQGARSTWYRFTAVAPCTLVDTEGSDVPDTLLQVFSLADPNDPCGSLTVIGCNDDGGSALLSRVGASGLTPGSTYYIEVANSSSATVPGNVRVRVSCPCPGDADGDGDVDQADLDLVLLHFGEAGVPPYQGGDLDGDGSVRQDDIDNVLFYFGSDYH